MVFGGTPPEGRTLLIGADASTDLDMFDAARIAIVQENFADFQALKARGLDVATAVAGEFDAAVVFLSRARAATRARIAAAVQHLRPAPRCGSTGRRPTASTR